MTVVLRTKSRTLRAGASLLAITAALSLGTEVAQAQTVTWGTGDYANSAGSTINGSPVGIQNFNGMNGTLTNGGSVNGTDPSDGYGVANGGFVAAVINSGTIAGDGATTTGAGILNNGTVGTLNNTGGVIRGDSSSGSAFGVVNLGNISALTNSGTIQANGDSASGIANMGYISTFSNTGGVIRSVGDSTGGGIVNAGTINILNISGGTVSASQGAGISNVMGGPTIAGSIGVLYNNGTISSDTNIAIGNQGDIGRLINNGVISAGGFQGVYNTGSIGTLTNSGTLSLITGASYGVHSDGTINVLTNEGSISGSAIAVRNGGSLGSLTNSGQITGGVGVGNNSGTLGTLTNSGTIAGTSAAVSNVASLGVLNNSGLLYSAGNAFRNYSLGTIGQIINSGVIAGTILNEATRDLTIAGGTILAEMGTLTGSTGGTGSADKGVILNASSNVEFSSGYLLLNNDISLGTLGNHRVNNTGATLQLNNVIAITGNYSQTGGGLIFTAATPSNYAYLNVFGDATISGSQITIAGGGLSEGNTFTIVRASGTGTYSGNSAYVAVTNGLGAIVDESGDYLIVTLIENDANTYTTKGQAAGGQAAPIGSVLDKVLAAANANDPTATGFKTGVLDKIDDLAPSSQGQAIKQLAPTQNAPSSQMSTAAASAVLGAVEQHQQTAMAYDPATGMAAGSDAHDSALWGQFLGGGARRGSNSEADGYSLWDFGLATGIDHRFTPNAMGGVALSWVRAWSSGSDNSSGSFTTLDSYQLTFYGTYRLDRAFIDGQAGFGWNEFDQKRAIGFLGSTASAQYSGQQYLAKTTVGYDLPVAGMTVTPLASLRWLRSVTEAYDEHGAGAANLSVDRQGVNSLSQDLGAKVTWEVPTGLGTLKPEARLAWVHDYTDGPVATSGVMGGQAFAVTVPRTEADGVRIGLAASLNGDDVMSFRVEYEGELRAQYQSHTGLVKAIWGF